MRKIKILISILILTTILSACGIPSDSTLNSVETPTFTLQQNDTQSTHTPTFTFQPSATIHPTVSSQPSQSNPTQNLDSTLFVHFIDVGQADCLLIKIDEYAMLIDAGNNADGDDVVKYIQDRGVSELQYVIGTHPHEDHIGGFDNVIRTFTIDTVIMPKAQNNTQTFEDVLDAITDKGLSVTTPVPGTEYSLGDAKFTILAPNSASYDDLNNYSVVIRLTYGNTAFLFEGDAEDLSEQEMLDAGWLLHADVLKVGHHGSSSSTSEIFLDAVNPAYAIISVGADNDYGHPAQDTLDKLDEHKVKVYRTDESGTIVAASNGNEIQFIFSTPTPAPKTTPSTAPVPTATPKTTPTPTPTISATQSPEPSPALTDNPGDQIVYITETGKKYHRTGCQYLKDSKIAISLADAVAKGYTPCSKCDPPELDK